MTAIGWQFVYTAVDPEKKHCNGFDAYYLIKLNKVVENLVVLQLFVLSD